MQGTEPIVHTTNRRTSANANPNPTPTESARKDPTDFLSEINLEVVELPSQSKPYPANVKIKYRGFMLGEVKKISESKNLSTRDRMKTLLDGISVEGMEKNDLTLNDVLYIALLRKISTLGDRPLSAEYTCGKCYKKHVYNFKLGDIEFHDLAAPKLPVHCDLTHAKDVAFSPLTIGRFLELVDLGKQDDDLAIVAMSCVNKDFDEIYKAVYTSNLDDVETLKEVDDVLEHGVKPVEFTCATPECTGKFKIEVDGEDTIFMPFRRPEKSTTSRLRFGD